MAARTKKGTTPGLVKKRMHIRSPQGLHARPAAVFVQVANRFKSTVRVRKGRRQVDGKSIMGLLTLAAEKGSPIEIITEGPDAQEAMHALEQLLSHATLPALVHVVRHHRSAHDSSSSS